MDELGGRRGAVHHDVGEHDTALALGSGDVAVLATPRLLAWCEEATCRALDGALGEGRTSVGVRVELDHGAATPVGGSVTAEAVVVEVDGPRVAFAVTVSMTGPDGPAVVATGRVVRVVVDRARFLTRAGVP